MFHRPTYSHKNSECLTQTSTAIVEILKFLYGIVFHWCTLCTVGHGLHRRMDRRTVGSRQGPIQRISAWCQRCQ